MNVSLADFHVCGLGYLVDDNLVTVAMTGKGLVFMFLHSITWDIKAQVWHAQENEV